MKRILFKLLTCLFPRKICPVFYSQWNRFIFKMAGVKLGKNSNMSNRVYLTMLGTNSKFFIGDNFTLSSGSGINPIARGLMAHIYVEDNATLCIADNVGMSSPCLWCAKKITIGNNVNIGANSLILDTDSHSLDYKERQNERLFGFKDRSKIKTLPVVIEDDVMVGANCIILKGVTIGARSVIAAGSVVTKNIPSDCIAGGNPARVIRMF